MFIQFQVVVYGEWGFLNHTSQELRDIEVEEEAGMYDDDVVVTQDIVDRVKEQAIIIFRFTGKTSDPEAPGNIHSYTKIAAICSFHHRPEENAISLSTLRSNGTAFRR